MELTVKSHRGSPINDFTKSVATLQQMALQVFFESLGCLSTLFPCKKSTVVTKKEMFIESCESFFNNVVSTIPRPKFPFVQPIGQPFYGIVTIEFNRT